MPIRTVFVVDGASGTGKTDLVEYIRTHRAHESAATVLQKFTTRKRRPYEKGNRDLDLDFVTEEEFERRVKSKTCYAYKYGDHRYGFRKSQLTDALLRHVTVFVIVRDRETIRNLQTDFPHVQIVPVFLYTDRDEIRKRLRRQHVERETIGFRLKRIEKAWNNYVQDPSLYSEVLINNSTHTDFHRLIDGLIRKYSTEPRDLLRIAADEEFDLVEPLVGYKDKLITRLANYPYEKNVFLMMKFRSGNRVVSDFIRKHLNDSGFIGVRADDPFWDITSDVYNPVAVLMCCKYGIALFDEAEEKSSFSPNVMYELGMMHLQRKRCLIVKHSTLPEAPFDLIKNLYVRYTRDLELEQIVKRWISEISRPWLQP